MKAVTRAALSACLAALIIGTSFAAEPARHYPIIDAHAHAFDTQDLSGIGWPKNRWTGQPTPRYTPDELRNETLRAMNKYNVVKAVISGRLKEVELWKQAAPERFVAGVATGGPYDISAADLEAKIRSGAVEAIGEMLNQYYGLRFDDSSVQYYYELAARHGLPVTLHSGLSEPEEVKSMGLTKFRVSLGNPMALEEILVKYPDMRVALGHAAYPFVQEVIGLLQMYPQLYLDLASIGYAHSPEGLHDFLRRLTVSGKGFDKRIMFGSDFYLWPEEQIGYTVAAIDSADFLTEDQKKDIFCRNAARFFKLDMALCDASGASTYGPSPEERVRTVMEAYIDATRTANPQEAKALFHPEARMSGDMDDQVRIGSPGPFLKALENASSAPPAGQAYAARIGQITVRGDTATATVTEQNLFGHSFTNLFHLVRADDRWQIVSKLYHATATGEPGHGPAATP